MKSKFSDLIQYFRTLATQHVDIGHSTTDKHFYRFELDEVLTGLKKVNYPALILEGYRYSLTDKQSDNVLKERSGSVHAPWSPERYWRLRCHAPVMG